MVYTTNFTTLPIKVPGRLIYIEVWFRRPGHASNFTPSEGTAQQCKTSAEVITTRIWVSVGKTTRFIYL